MRKLISRIVSSIKKAVVATGTWFKNAFIKAWHAVKATTRWTANVAVGTVKLVGITIAATLHLAVTLVLAIVDTLVTLVQKALTLATLLVMLPFMVFYGKLSVVITARAIWMTVRHWRVITVSDAIGATIVVDETEEAPEVVAPVETPAPVVIEVETILVESDMRKGRPTPKQRKHRPARFPRTA
jgi:hypothetical protein